MSATIKKRDFLIVAVIAILIEGILIWVVSHRHASHSPTLLQLFHLPGIVLVELMHIPDPQSLIILGITGTVQLFVVFFIGLVIWKQIYGQHDA